ncbi:putative bifunctional diguanylate cyclase/phosphodiesterase [Microvirga solisilvae]|uniref:putative bifunctional diguanylate cyclase/phosphodiesterase n=1 Tax=Microvirga solisilvae TaxID=2919498 RepID=UPI001FAEA7E2|nr:EAL domain-containing protein [Microvirga solisilvae]
MSDGLHFPIRDEVSAVPSIRAHRAVQARIALAVSLVTLIALILTGFALYWASRESNSVSIERQLRTTERSIRAIVNELALQQEVVAIWDDAIVQLDKDELDFQWIDANLGIWLSKTFGQDEVYILNADDRPIYAGVDGKRVSTDAFRRVSPDIARLVKNVRESQSLSHAGHGPNARELHLTTNKAIVDAHLLELLGRPTAVSVMKIVPESDAVRVEPGREHLLVSIRFLDGSFINQISERNLIDGLRFSRLRVGASDEITVPLTSDEGGLIGYFHWKPELPGQKILSFVGPVAAATSLAIVVVMVLLVRSLRRLAAQQEMTIVELRASQAQAQHLAFHDVLTGLPNRALFDARLDEALSRTRRGEQIAVLMLDLDRFKHVNDNLGHQAGDNLIRAFAQRLLKLVRPGDTVARLGGDEFAVIQTGIRSAEDAEELCTHILAALDRPFETFGHQIFAAASIGIALAPEFGTDRVDIMRKADIALYSAKDEGRDCYRIFTAAMDEAVKVRSSIEDELRSALRSGEGLSVVYQPQFKSNGHSIVGLETLVRWKHPTRGPILPEQFIPVAEQTGLISRLGEWVLQQACMASKQWPDLFISVNVSPAQFRVQGFAERVTDIVRESGADPRKIELEITEGVLLDNAGETASTLRQLRAAGFRIALDDFGTGYSSLGYLQRFSIDKIKIDRSFVMSLGQTANAMAIVKSIVALGQAMDLTVTAEGVETEHQKSFLSTAGCNEMQGFLFSKALPLDQVARLLAA